MVTRILLFHFLLYGYEDTFVWLRGNFCMVTRISLFHFLLYGYEDTFVWLRKRILGFHFSIFFCSVTRILLYGYEDTRIPLFHFPLYGC
jgi:hypothetical protein